MVSDLGQASISCVLLTDNLSAATASWFLEVRELVDEFVIFVDRSRATDETRSLARQMTSSVKEIEGQGCIEPHLPEMVRACRCDWILRLDSDERLSRAWSDGTWRRRLTTSRTHFTTPRRWMHPAGGYLNCSPWWPDPQLRLFRNDPARIVFPQQIHEPMRVEGEGEYLSHLVMEHHVLRLASRAERETKVRHYTRLRPELPLGEYYLFEDQPTPTRGEIPLETEAAVA